MEGHTLRMWERITSVKSDDLRNSVIADFGCGSGRFVEIVRMKRGKVIGIDISAAVEAGGHNFEGDSNVLICQADLLRPPVKPESVDGAFSIGVLHHTPDPRRGFQEMEKVVKSGGWVAVSAYGKGGYYDSLTVRFYRRFFRVLYPMFRHYPALLYAYFSTYALRPVSYIYPFFRIARSCGISVCPLEGREMELA